VTQAFEHEATIQQSSEEIQTQTVLRFWEYMLELAKRDPEWKETLKEKADAFRRLEV
jgi:hypothetical protein